MVGSYDMIAWIHSSGRCGLSGSDWSMDVDLARSEGQPERDEGFSGPTEPAVGSTPSSVRGKRSRSHCPARPVTRGG